MSSSPHDLNESDVPQTGLEESKDIDYDEFLDPQLVIQSSDNQHILIPSLSVDFHPVSTQPLLIQQAESPQISTTVDQIFAEQDFRMTIRIAEDDFENMPISIQFITTESDQSIHDEEAEEVISREPSSIPMPIHQSINHSTSPEKQQKWIVYDEKVDIHSHTDHRHALRESSVETSGYPSHLYKEPTLMFGTIEQSEISSYPPHDVMDYTDLGIEVIDCVDLASSGYINPINLTHRSLQENQDSVSSHSDCIESSYEAQDLKAIPYQVSLPNPKDLNTSLCNSQFQNPQNLRDAIAIDQIKEVKPYNSEISKNEIKIETVKRKRKKTSKSKEIHKELIQEEVKFIPWLEEKSKEPPVYPQILEEYEPANNIQISKAHSTFDIEQIQTLNIPPNQLDSTTINSIESQGFFYDEIESSWKKCKWIYALYYLDDKAYKYFRLQLMRHKNKKGVIIYTNFECANFERSTKEGACKVRVWRFPYVRQPDDDNRFQLRICNKEGNKDFYESYGTFKPYPSNELHHFLWDITIISKKEFWGFSKVDPPGKSIAESLEQIFYYLVYLIEKTDYFITVPLILKQLWKVKYDNLSYESLDNFLKYLDEYIQNTSHINLEAVCLSILSVLGSSKSMTIAPNHCFNSTDTLLRVLLGNINSSVNKWKEEFMREYTINGLLQLIILDLKFEGNAWFDILENLTSSNYLYKLCKGLIQAISESKLQVRPDLYLLILSKTASIDHNDLIHILPYISPKSLPFDEFIQILCKFFNSTVPTSSTDKKGKKPMNREEKRMFTNVVNRYLYDFTLTLEDILTLLKILHDMPRVFRETIYDSSFDSKIGVAIYRGYKDRGNLPILQAMYNDYYDPTLLQKIRLDKFTTELISQCDYTLAEVLNSFNLDSKSAKDLLKNWIERSIKNRISLEKLVNLIDRELINIHSMQPISAINEYSIECLSDICYNKHRDLLSIAARFDNVELPEFRNAYIDYVTTHLLNKSYHERNGNTVKRLEDLLKKEEDSQMLITLLAIALELGDSLTEDKVKKDLLNDPCGQNHWIVVINNYSRFSEKKFFKTLLGTIYNIGYSIVHKTIIISDINTLNRHNKQNRDQFIQIIVKVFEKKRECLDREFTFYMQEALDLLSSIYTKINNLEVFFSIIGKSMEDYQQIANIFSSNTHNLDRIPLISFNLSSKLDSIIHASTYIEPVNQSVIFLNYLQQEKASSSVISSSTVSYICTQAFNKMYTDISTLFTNFDDSRMANLWEKLTIEKSVEKETGILFKFFRPNTILKDKFSELIQYLQTRSYIHDICKTILLLRDSIGFKDEIMFALCNHYINQVIEKINSIPVYYFIQNSMSITKKLKENLMNDEFEEIGSILRELSISNELVEYLQKLNDGQIHDLIEGVNDYDDSFVNTQTILNLSNIWKFNLEIIQGARNYETLVSNIKNKLDVPEYKQLVQQLKTCNTQLNSIKDLHNELFCKEEAKKRQIFEIYKDSHFKIDSAHKRQGFDIQLRYTSKPNHVINLFNLLELKDRASLYKNPSNTRLNENSPEDLNKISVFIEFVNSVNNITRSLNNLYDNGYPGMIYGDKEFVFQGGVYREVRLFEDTLVTQLKEWDGILRDAYDRYYWLTYLNGRQFWKLEKHLFSDNPKVTNQAINLLVFMQKDHTQCYPVMQAVPYSISDRLTRLGQALQYITTIPHYLYRFDIQIRNIHQNYRQIIYLETNKTLHGLISLFLNSKSSFPRAYQVFYCKSNTKWRELNAFLYRCFRNPPGELFVLIDCENLSLENQNKFQSLFNYLYYESTIESNFKFGLITSDSRSTLSQYFKYTSSLKVIKLLESYILSEDNIRHIIQTVDKSSQVLTSTISGLGKSEYIRQNALHNSLQSILFCISGEIDMHTICNKFQSLHLSNQTQLNIHINYLDDSKVINDFISKLSLFGIYSDSYDMISIPSTTPVYIEIANTYQEELYNSLPYLKYLKTIHIHEFDINSLLIPPEPTSPIQLVCSYLHYYDNKQINHIEIDLETQENMLVQTQDAIIQLLNKYFITKQIQKGQEVSYTQLFVFISVLDKLLRNFQKSGFFHLWQVRAMIADLNAQNMQALAADYATLRERVIEGLLLTTEEFTTKSLSNAKTMQNEAQRNKLVDDYDDDQYINNFKCNFAWESSNHFNVIFLKEGDFVSIYRDKEMVPENIKKLLLIQGNHTLDGNTILRMIQNKSYNIADYSTMVHYDLLQKLQNFNNREEFVWIYMDSEYVITPDNYLKMNLIYIKALAKLPIILMGETGCGKTRLVEFFVCDVLNEKFRKISIHAGITSEDIYEELSPIVQKARRKEYKRYWVFFDEFNTSYCIGTLCNIMCDRIFDGQKIPDNIVLLGACNPYRIKGKKVCFDENVGIRNRYRDTHSEFKLIHVVKPLPDVMLDYVCDFGQLQEQDFEKYIEKMLEQGTKRKIVSTFVKLICASHRYFKTTEDASSVSLRDVRRFIILYKWFRSSLKIKEQIPEDRQYISNANKYNLHKRAKTLGNTFKAGILALCHCYYLRISSQDQRNHFISTILKGTDIKESLVFDVLDDEMNDYLARMELPSGTALNTALKENVFAVIPCILNQIPIIICGKPGCSKSLAIQLIFTNLRGKKSNDGYFKTLKELTMVSFQGSDSCTSEGINKAFERAKKYLETSSKVLLPVVVFDEIGLAEISRHNPLKVLHSLLELENRSVGFVGISNWRLDASKMNRAVYLARPDPDKQDLIYTAFSIYDSYSRGYNRHEALIQNLAYAYFGFKQKLKSSEYADFYGLRDFYHLIKSVSHNLIQSDVTDRQQQAFIVKRAIERNFGGLAQAADSIGSIFSELQRLNDIYFDIKTTNVLDLINDNLNDRSARYLMLICKGDIGTFILDRFLKISRENRRILIGSSLEEDLNQGEYGFSSLSDVILYAEKGISVILKDMDHIYSSLYDLFNQNFAVSGDRKYCRIAMGALFNPRCFIHDDFHAIVVMNDDGNSIMKADAPFLNRFEKQCIDLFDLIHQETHKLIIQELITWLSLIFEIQLSRGEKLYLSLKNILPIYNKENIALLVLYNYREDLTHHQLLTLCKTFLLQVASPDILLMVELSKLDHEESQFVSDSWKDIHSASFPQLLERYHTNQSGNKIVVFTYGNEILGSVYHTTFDTKILHVSFSTLKSEQDIRKELINFFESDSYEFYLMELDLLMEGAHLSMLKFLIDKLELETRSRWKCSKTVFVIIHMKRNINYESNINILNGWDYWMCNDLTINALALSDEILHSSTLNLIMNEQLISIEDTIEQLIEKCILKFKYERSIYYNNPNTFNYYIFEMIDHTKKHYLLKSAFKSKILKILQEREKQLKSWNKQIFYDADAIDSSIDLHTAINSVLLKEIESAFTIVLYLVEKHQAFKSFFTDDGEAYSSILKGIWMNKLQDLGSGGIMLQAINQSIITKFGVHLRFPFIKLDYALLGNLFKKFKEDSREKSVLDPEALFLEEFLSKSVIAKYKESIDENEILKEIYIKDIIKLYLSDHLFELKHEHLVFKLLENMVYPTDSLPHKLLIFFSHKELFYYMLTVFHSMQEFPIYESTLKIDRIINEFMALQKDLENNWKDLFGNVLTALIKVIAPNQETLLRAGWSKTYPELSAKISHALMSLRYNHSLRIKDLKVLEFWIQYILLIQKLNISENTLEDSITLANSHKEAEIPHIFSKEFLDHIYYKLDHIIESDISLEDTILRFYSCYYLLLLKYNPNSIVDLASRLEQTDLWKYSGNYINRIISKSHILKLIHTIELHGYEQAYEEEHYHPNKYLHSIEEALICHGLTSRFAILISDSISVTLQNSQDLEESAIEHKGNQLNSIINIFHRFSNANQALPTILISTHQLISLIYVRKGLDLFCKILSDDSEFTKDDLNTIQDILKCIETDPNGDTYKLYCLKRIKQLKNITNSELYSYLNSKSFINWTEIQDISPFSAKLSVFPFVVSVSDNYLLIAKRLSSLYAGGLSFDDLDEFISQNTPENKLTFGLAVLNEIFTSYLYNSEMQPNVRLWHHQKANLIQEKLGREYKSLLDNFIMNYPENSYLRLSSQNSKDLPTILTMCFITLIVISYSNITSPITSLFFEPDGSLNNLSERFNRMYLFGLESQDSCSEYYSTLEYYIGIRDKKFIPEGTQLYKCSCDYIYYIANCGQPGEEGLCPQCKQKIGGVNHTLIQRPGHEQITIDKAIEIIQGKINTYEQKAIKGYVVFKSGSTNLRGLNSISIKLMHIILNTMLYSLKATNLISTTQLQNLVKGKTEEALIHSIIEDLDFIYHKLDCDEGFVWIYHVLSQLPDLISSNNHELLTIPLRADFEKKFESELIICNLDSCTNIIQRFKHMILDFINMGSKYVNLLDEITLPHNQIYSNLPLFRLRREPSFENLMNVFNILQNKQEYGILELYFNHIRDFEKLAYFYPIIKFTNYMLDKFNHRITRREARETPIRAFFQDDKKLNTLYDQFLIAYRSSEFRDLQYECHVLPSIEFDYDSTLIHFLVDVNNEYGGGMYMAVALITYGTIQNNLLTNIVHLLSKVLKIEENVLLQRTDYPVQTLKKSHILIPSINRNDMINAFSINNWDLGKGKEILYNFETIQKALVKELITKKFVDTENLNLIQYQFELMNTTSSDSGIIIKIRQDIPQQEFDQKTYEKVEYFFKQLEIKQKGAFNLTLKEIYNSLNDVLCYLKNSRQPPQYTIGAFVSSIKSSRISKYFSENNFISSLRLEYITSLFEYIEHSFFPFIRKYVSKEYKAKHDSEIVEDIVTELVSRCDHSMPDLNQIETAMMRFISRYLITSLDCNLKLKDYIAKEDIWNVSVSKYQILNFQEIFPDKLILSHSMLIYKNLNRINHPLLKRQIPKS